MSQRSHMGCAGFPPRKRLFETIRTEKSAEQNCAIYCYSCPVHSSMFTEIDFRTLDTQERL